MDLINQLFSYIPVNWRPYIAIAVIAWCVITKTRSMIKTGIINQLMNQLTITPAPVIPIAVINATSTEIKTFSANISTTPLLKEEKKPVKKFGIINFVF